MAPWNVNGNTFTLLNNQIYKNAWASGGKPPDPLCFVIFPDLKNLVWWPLEMLTATHLHFWTTKFTKMLELQGVSPLTPFALLYFQILKTWFDGPLKGKRQQNQSLKQSNLRVFSRLIHTYFLNTTFTVQLPFRSMTDVGQLLCLHFEVIPKRIDIVDLRSFYALAHELSKEVGFRKSLWVSFLV